MMLLASSPPRETVRYEMKQADKKGMLKSLRVSIDATLSEKGKPPITSPSADGPYINTSLWKSGKRTSFQLTHPADGKQYSAYFAVVGLGPSGQGGYAEVWKCQVTADIVRLPWSHVAVKSFRYETLPPPGKTYPNTRALKELAIWRALRHQYVAPLLGSFESSTQCLITTWYNCGNLFDFVRKEDINSDRIRILKEIVEGLGYLHSQNVIHGDIHNGNVLATRDERGSIHPVYIDFGLSKLLEESYGERIITSSIRQKGRMIYMAPELLLYTYPPRHKASDIYALSLLLLEVSV
ncbi:hypothetical protein FS837_002391 [Tulasnella sp. UAMH 9824]|nr:hypothetical protein FS837_002391 [Tulasnella sp. UAMH 9824]